MIKEGRKARLCCSRDLVTIVGETKDGDTNITIYKQWSPYKKAWYYNAERTDLVEYQIALSKQVYLGKYGEGKRRNQDEYNNICEKYNLKK